MLLSTGNAHEAKGTTVPLQRHESCSVTRSRCGKVASLPRCLRMFQPRKKRPIAPSLAPSVALSVVPGPFDCTFLTKIQTTNKKERECSNIIAACLQFCTVSVGSCYKSLQKAFFCSCRQAERIAEKISVTLSTALLTASPRSSGAVEHQGPPLYVPSLPAMATVEVASLGTGSVTRIVSLFSLFSCIQLVSSERLDSSWY